MSIFSSNLKSYPSFFKEREERHATFSKKLLQWIEAIETGKDSLIEARSPLHSAYLYGKAVLGFTPEEIVSIGKSYLVVKTKVENSLLIEPLEGQILFDFTKLFLPQLIETIEKQGIALLDEILSYRLKSASAKRRWERVERGVYKTETLKIDLNAGTLTQGSKMEGSLPAQTREDLKELFAEEILKGIFTFTYVELPNGIGKAWHVALSQDGISYDLYLRDKDPNFPLLYRHQKEQWIRIHNMPEDLPIDFKKGFIWSQPLGAMTHRIENAQALEIYQAQFAEERLTQLSRIVNNKHEVVLNPDETRLFERLDMRDGFIVTLKNDCPTVTYLRGSAEYSLNRETRVWQSTTYKGYFLSPKPLEKFIAHEKTGRPTPFFASHFSNYHLLENSEGKGKLLLRFCNYQMLATHPSVADKEMKYTTQIVPAEEPTTQKRAFVVFDLENGILKSKRPQDLFFLAFTLFVQGKYGTALLYLQRSRAVWNATDPAIRAFRDQTKEWILGWSDPSPLSSSPNALAFKTKMLKMEHGLRESTFPEKQQVLTLDTQLLPALMQTYEAYLQKEILVDPVLRLSESEKREIVVLVPRAFGWIQPKIVAQVASPLISKKMHDFFTTKRPNQEEALQWGLDQEIEALENIPQQTKVVPKAKAYTPLPLFTVSDWLEPVKEENNQGLQKAKEFAKQLLDVFTGDTLADEMGKELAQDVLSYVDKIEKSFTIAENADLEKLKDKVLLPLEQSLVKQEKHLQQRIYHQFLSLPLTIAESVKRQLKEQETQADYLLEKALHCLGSDDFSELIAIKAITSGQVDSLKTLLKSFAIARADRLLMTRKRLCVERLMKEPKNPTLRQECADLLQEWRQYDPETHPIANSLLLLENTLNVNSRPGQIEHINNHIAHPQSYHHLAMAFGKTSHLRNAISDIEGKKGKMAGVMTYAPLMAMHHPEYDEVHNLAFGLSARPVFYHRNAAHDVVALKLMIKYHLKALKQKERIDQTPQATISLNHTLTEFVTLLKGSDPLIIQELGPSINALQKLLRLRKDHLSVYSDEIDKIYDAMKDYTYAKGAVSILEQKYYAPALALIDLLMNKKSLSSLKAAIQQNHLPQLTDKVYHTYLRTLAEEAIDLFKLPFDRATTLDYLTEAHELDDAMQEKMVAFYENVILKHHDADTVLTIQILHSLIGVLFKKGLKNKMVGSDFGRSKDGISVKPFSFSAVCQENSQRSFLLATVLEICVDYLVSGISLEGVDSYVEKMKEYAMKELPEAESLDKTPIALNFKQRFSLSLTQVKAQDYPAIKSKLESSFPLFQECIVEILLKNFTYYTNKIDGNPYHLKHLLNEITGASGSPERLKTLAFSIQKHAHLIRQSGAIGSVFYALLKDLVEERDFVKIESEKPIAQQLAKHLNPGDGLVDNVPFFPGKKDLEIVEALAQEKPELSAFRLLNEENAVCNWDRTQVRLGEEGINLETTVSMISHKGRQGTNWAFAKGTKGIVGIGPLTELTSFTQSLMRFRPLGKGQTGMIAYTETLVEEWDKIPALKDKSLLTKAAWTLVQNEANLLKPLHYHSNKKQIRVLRTQAIDTIKSTVTDIQALAQINALEHFTLITPTPLDPKAWGYPILLKETKAVLEKDIESEKTHLLALKGEIAGLKMEKSIIAHCIGIIDKTITELDKPDLLLPTKDLPDRVSVNHASSDATEEIEIETETQVAQEVQAQTQSSIDIEVEMELDAEQQMSSQIDTSSSLKHPENDEGREMDEYAINHSWWQKLLRREDIGNHSNGYIDPVLFPEIMVSNHALGIYRINCDATFSGGNMLRQSQLWIYGEPELESCFGSKLMLVVLDGKEVHAQIGSVKETDFFFSRPMLEKQEADEWIDMPLEEAKKKDPSQMPPMQKKAIDDGPDYYKARQEEALSFQKAAFYKMDIHETTLPASLPAAARKKWIERMALCKFLYVDAPLNKEEKAFLINWLSTTWRETSPISLDELESRLRSYLNRFYPNTRNNPLLSVIKQAKTK